MTASSTEQNLAVVRRICEHWNTLGIDEWRELCDPAMDYRNIPIEGDRHTGPDEAHAMLSRFAEKWEVGLEVNAIAAAGDAVLTERTEHFSHRAGTKAAFDLPVMGAFELRDGKVTAWRDYFELSHLRLR